MPSNSSGQHNPESWDIAMTSEAPPPSYTSSRENRTIYTDIGGKDVATLNAIQLLNDNGIDQGNSSDTQFASFKNQNPATQHKSTEAYLNYRRQLDARIVNNELREGSSLELPTCFHNVKEPVSNSQLPSPSDRKQGRLSNSPPSSCRNPSPLPGLLGPHNPSSRSPQVTPTPPSRWFSGQPLEAPQPGQVTPMNAPVQCYEEPPGYYDIPSGLNRPAGHEQSLQADETSTKPTMRLVGEADVPRKGPS